MIITTRNARALSLDELRAVMTFADYDALSWWDDFDVQGILDTMHACGDWDGVAAWCSKENPDWKKAHASYASILKQCRLRARRAPCFACGGTRRRRTACPVCKRLSCCSAPHGWQCTARPGPKDSDALTVRP